MKGREGEQMHIPHLEQLLFGALHQSNTIFVRSSLWAICSEGNDMMEKNPISNDESCEAPQPMNSI